MIYRSKYNTRQAIDAWKQGKSIRSLVLGNHQADQDRAYAYAFHLLELFSINGIPADHDAFLAACDEYEQTFSWGELPVKEAHAFNVERDAAESLVWKALLVGLKKAIDGHGEAQYTEVQQVSNG